MSCLVPGGAPTMPLRQPRIIHEWFATSTGRATREATRNNLPGVTTSCS